MADVEHVDQSKQKKTRRRRNRKVKKDSEVQITDNKNGQSTDNKNSQSTDNKNSQRRDDKNSQSTDNKNSQTTGNKNSQSTDNNTSGTGQKARENSQKTEAEKTDSTKGKKNRRRRADRYFGKFCCRICKRTWESAFVFTRAGTKKVLFKQRCQKCNDDDAWMNPFDLQILRCSVCQSDICDCQCEDCHKLIHLRYKLDVKEKVDDSFEYCDCEKRKKRKSRVGAHIRLNKPHLSDLCERCKSGIPCTGRLSDNDDPQDNEP